jgi:hypothetical protein
MTQVSKPLLGLLAASVIGLALMMVAFKGPSSSAGGSRGVGTYQTAINQAHSAVATSNAANAAAGGNASSTAAPSHRSSSARPASTAAAPHAAKPAGSAPAKPSAAALAQDEVNVLQAALAAHRVIGLLFYNPAASDDAAVAKELAAAATAPGVVKLMVPVANISRFTMITNDVPVTSSPTLLLIDRTGDATPLTGFADRFEIAARLNALVSH